MRQTSLSAVEPETPVLFPFPSSQPEYVYRLLNNRFLDGPWGRWRLCIYAVVETVGEVWVQAALIGQPAYSVLLRLRGVVDAQGVLRAVQSWLSVRDAHDDHVIDVDGEPRTPPLMTQV